MPKIQPHSPMDDERNVIRNAQHSIGCMPGNEPMDEDPPRIILIESPDASEYAVYLGEQYMGSLREHDHTGMAYDVFSTYGRLLGTKVFRYAMVLLKEHVSEYPL